MFSYDEIVRLWDTRNMKRSYNNVNVNGGVWRLKWEPKNEDYILSASMFNAVHIIDASLNEANICQSFGDKKTRLFYGADWCHLNENKRMIAACSFYDHRLDLFVVNMKL